VFSWGQSSSLADALLLRLGSGFAERSGRTTTGQLPFLLFFLPDGEQFGIVVGLLLSVGDALALEGLGTSGALEDDGGDEPLDLGGLRLRLVLTLLQLDWPPDDVLSDVIVLLQVEEFPDLSGTFGAETARDGGVGQAWDFCFSLLDNDEVEDRQVSINDAPTDAPAMSLAITPGPVALVISTKQEADATIGQYALHHGETLLVIAASNPEDVSFPLITKRVPWNFLRHLFIKEDPELPVIFNLNELLASSGRIGDVQLHLYLSDLLNFN